MAGLVINYFEDRMLYALTKSKKILKSSVNKIHRYFPKFYKGSIGVVSNSNVASSRPLPSISFIDELPRRQGTLEHLCQTSTSKGRYLLNSVVVSNQDM